MAGEVWQLTAVEIADGVRGGDLSAREVLDVHLARIDALNPGINAFVFLDRERASQVASEVDAAVGRGEDPGPLAGVPLGIKELETVEGWPHTRATVVYRDRIGTETTVMTSRLLRAGAVPIGLTAASEWGLLYFTNSALHGVTRNPWNLERTPGGSSGGAGAALAAGLVPLATGSDQGGSIRLPAGWCGVVGVKGTYGRVPRSPGYLGNGNLIHYGPLARSVRDAARYLDCACGVDGRDPGSLPAPPLPFEESIRTIDTTGLRVGLALGTSLCPSDPGVRSTVAEAARAVAAGAGWNLTEDVRVDMPALASSAGSVVAADMDPAVAPRFAEIAMSIASTEGAGPLIAMAADPAGATFEGVIATTAIRHELNMALAALFDRFDLLVLPTSPVPAFGAAGPVPLTVDGQDVGAFAPAAFSFPFNLSGHPVVSVPAGMVAGAPVGLQIIGRRHDDALVLAAAATYERLRPWPTMAPYGTVTA